MTKVLKALIAKVPKYCMSNPGISFLAKNTSKKRIDSKKVLESIQNMKGEIVRSIECNSTISPFLGRWQNLTESKKHIIHIHKTTIEIEKNICIYKQYMYMNYNGKKNTKNLSLLSLFVIRTRKEGRKKNLEIRMFTSFSAS